MSGAPKSSGRCAWHRPPMRAEDFSPRLTDEQRVRAVAMIGKRTIKAIAYEFGLTEPRMKVELRRAAPDAYLAYISAPRAALRIAQSPITREVIEPVLDRLAKETVSKVALSLGFGYNAFRRAFAREFPSHYLAQKSEARRLAAIKINAEREKPKPKVRTRRACLGCRHDFLSTGPGNRLCPACGSHSDAGDIGYRISRPNTPLGAP